MNYAAAENDALLAITYSDTLLRIGAASIRHGLTHGRPLPITAEDYPARLRLPRATFVTLQELGALRGCIGAIVAQQPLIESVATNAYGAAFEDPRFPPLTAAAWQDVTMGISILSALEPVLVASEADALREIRPGRDGLVIVDDGRRAVLLPQVWDMLPDHARFLAALKEKAGIAEWTPATRLERFDVTSIPEAPLTTFG